MHAMAPVGQKICQVAAIVIGCFERLICLMTFVTLDHPND